MSKNLSQKTHILIVDDDDRIRELLRRYLGKRDYIVNTASDASDALQMLDMLVYDLLIVDVMMPGQSGFELTQSLRERSDIPVILLTAKGETADRIEGLSSGADDYLSKPFDPEELVLRIEAILRRANQFKAAHSPTVRIGPWIFKHSDMQLTHHERVDETRSLTEKEYQLVSYLVGHGNKAVTRDDLSKAMGLSGNDRTIDVQITRLRKKLGDSQKPPRILQTLRGKGYLLKIEHVYGTK